MGVAQQKRVAVVVLGDIGRSPRMQYHARALAEHDMQVDLVGYTDTPLPQALASNARIRCHPLRDSGGSRRFRLPRPLFLAAAGMRLLRQAVQLFRAMARMAQPSIILAQIPPALPTLLVLWLAARRRGARLILDWHNFGYAMLALRLGPQHPIVGMARRLEGMLARRADAHLCVSDAMRERLSRDWGIAATVLYDRPAAAFRAIDDAGRRALFQRLPDLLPGYDPQAPGRPALIVSSTSWSADEDFALLLDAAAAYDARHAAAAQTLPDLLILITGRGPLQATYEARFAARSLRHVGWRTAWLEAADYPLLLGAADLGVSVHRSSSGVDLPMKVADMLGSGLPVCMLDYGPCVREILDPGRNGVLFRNAAELAAHWATLLDGFPGSAAPLQVLRARLAETQLPSWSDGWRATARPLFQT